MISRYIKIGLTALAIALSIQNVIAEGWAVDKICLAKTIYHEARGEPYEGQVAVAHVVINRSNSAKFPDTICKVVLQPGQFHFSKVKKIYDLKSYDRAKNIAEKVLVGEYADPTKGALYFAHYRAVAGRSVYKKYIRVKIGQHYFWTPKS